MSANTSITEGGKPRPFGPVVALMVQGEDGKYYPWFPESDRALGTLSVEKNGIYRASDRGVYGWSRVYVNVPTDENVTGKGDDGNEYCVKTDEEGNIIKTKSPSELRIVTAPTKTEYIGNENIDYSGIVVNSYYADGTMCKTVPLSELILPVERAIFDEDKYIEGGYYAFSELNIWPFDQPIGFTAGNLIQYKPGSRAYYTSLSASGDCKIVCFFYHKETTQWGEEFYPGYTLFASESEFTCTKNNPSANRRVQKWTYNGKDVWFTSEAVALYTAAGDSVDYQPSTNANLIENAVFSGVESQKVAWTILHGDITYEPGGATQTIPIYWQRPCDGTILQAAFDVVVNQTEGEN